MALTRCECCDGRRTIVGLGGMKRDCDNCHGVGFVKIEEILEPVIVKRKRHTSAEMLADADKGE